MPKNNKGFPRSVPRKSVPPPNNKPISSNEPDNSGLGATLLSNLTLGATIGAGSSIGHRAVDSLMTSNSESQQQQQQQQQQQPQPKNENLSCQKLIELFDNCLKNNNTNCDYLNELVIKKCNI